MLRGVESVVLWRAEKEMGISLISMSWAVVVTPRLCDYLYREKETKFITTGNGLG